MKTIESMLDSTNKFGDTSTVFQLRLKDDKDAVSLDDKPVTLNIANAYGFVMTQPVTMVYGDMVTLDFNSTALSQLTPDKYKLEIVVTMDDGDVAKFPTEGGMPFTITKDLKATTGELVPTITFDEVLDAVDKKVDNYLATVVKGDKGDKGDVGDVDATKNYTFTGNNTFTQPINGSLKTREATFASFKSIANDTVGYSGFWIIRNQVVADGPNGNTSWVIVDVTGLSGGAGQIKVYDFGNNDYYATSVNNSSINGWYKISKDASVLHNTGNETVAGDKTFTGSTTFTQPIVGSLKTRNAPFSDFNDVANDMIKYSGNWSVQGVVIRNDPTGADGGLRWYNVNVTPAYGGNTGYIQIEIVDGIIYNTGVNNGKIIGWHLIPHNDDVLHNTGNETASGDKTFAGALFVNGGFEIGGNVPYIDFHFADSNEDYTARIVEFTKGTLSLNTAGGARGSLDAIINSRGTLTGTVDVLAMAKAAATNSGMWKLSGVTIDRTNQSELIWGTLQINPIGNDSGAELIIIASSGINGVTSQLIGYGDSGSSFITWRKLADDSTVVHNTGTETVGGDKSFSGKLTVTSGVPTQVQQSATVEFPMWYGSTMKATRFGNMVTLHYATRPTQNIPAGTVSTQAIPLGFRPADWWYMAAGGGNSGAVEIGPNGKLNVRGNIEVQYPYAMTATYFTGDAFPTN